MAGAAALATNMWTLMSLFLSVSALEGCPWRDEVSLTTTTPEKMEALKGACLQIPCTYNATQALNSSGQFAGFWMTHGLRTDEFPGVKICNSEPNCQYQMKIIGDLKQRHCTTEFGKFRTDKNERIYFRIESGDFKATAVCSPIQITIRESISPKISVPDDLKEKMTVTITCSAPAPCPGSPPTLIWNLQANAQDKLEQNGDGTFTVKIQQSITLSEHDDGKNISCSATYPVDGREKKPAQIKETLSVSYAPKDTSASVSPSNTVSAGSSVTLNCSSRAKPPITRFAWYRRSGKEAEYEGAVYTLNVTEGGVYYCKAENDIGSKSSAEIHLTVIGEESDMKVIIIAGAAVSILFVLVCALVIFKKCRSSRPAEPMTQSQTAEPVGDQETLHYGEISFNKARPVATPDPAQDDGSQQDTVYAQVRVAAAENTNDIYAQVKKK